jgi:TPP-dependent pyruvate/acetoin dehydrogenase alpha subunit
VYEATSEAAARARRGDGPTLIEAEVVRLVAHSNADDQAAYRAAADLAAAQARDPLPRLRERLLAEGVGAEALAAWEREARRQAEAALEWAEAAPDPDPADARRHLYAGE